MKHFKTRMIAFALAAFSCAALQAANFLGVDDAKIEEVKAMLVDDIPMYGAPITDRAYWDSFYLSPKAKSAANKYLARGELPMPTKQDYIDWKGDKAKDLKLAVSALVLAECKENKGRYLKAAIDAIDKLAGDWCWMAKHHDYGQKCFNGTELGIDLESSTYAYVLATSMRLLGDRIPAEVQAKVNKKLDDWIVKPLLRTYKIRTATGWGPSSNLGRQDWMYIFTNNWNGYCNAWSLGTVLQHVKDPAVRAEVIANVAASITRYMDKAFDDEGYVTEGKGYYYMGIHGYLTTVDLIRRATGGKMDILRDNRKKIDQVLLYPHRYAMCTNGYPHFADDGADGYLTGLRQIVFEEIDYVSKSNLYREVYLGKKPDWTGILPWDLESNDMNAALQKRPAGRSTLKPEVASCYKNSGVMISRDLPGVTFPFSLAAKAGHNNEQHNHNDVGSYCIALGHEIQSGDPGVRKYTQDNFTKARYNYPMNNSFGHPVPVIDDTFQGTGKEFKGTVTRSEISREERVFAIDFKDAYPVASLKKLERTFVHRPADRVITVTDEVEFNGSGTFEDAIISYRPIKKISDNVYQVGDTEVTFESEKPLKIEVAPLEDLYRHPKYTAQRLSYGWDAPVSSGKVTVTYKAKK